MFKSVVISSTILYANSCPEWAPIPIDDLMVVVPIYDKSITEPDMDCDGIIDTKDTDIDGDGVSNSADAFPTNSSESIDTDGDGIGNNADTDDDNDGLSDKEEIKNGTNPLNADTDGDGVNDKDDTYPNDNTFLAVEDIITKDTIEETTIDVLVNDIIKDGSEGTILFEVHPEYDEVEYRTFADSEDGNWSVIDNKVVFAPYSNFNGGYTSVGYQLTDESGHVQVVSVGIHFPILLEAIPDKITKETIEETTVDVRANDTVTDGSEGSVIFKYCDDETHCNEYDGNWTIVDNEVVFSPSSIFMGGGAFASYYLLDESGREEWSYVLITFPYIIHAEFDDFKIDTVEETTIDVLTNDIITDGSTGSILLREWTDNGYENVSSTQTRDGNWTISDNNVIFTPNDTFMGGDTYVYYQLSDESDHSSIGRIRLTFPYIIHAKWDNLETDTLEEVTINVLENDTISDGTSGTILLKDGDEYVSDVETEDGNWSVVDNAIVFTPSNAFNGGYAYHNYQLSDESDHQDTTIVWLEFPIVLRAAYDNITKETLEETTVDVLANDTITDGSEGTLLLRQWTDDGYEYVSDIETDEGNWSIADNTVVFTPNNTFNGGNVRATYQLSDESNHSDINGIYIKFPIVLDAKRDEITKDTIEETTVNVVENDIIEDGSEGTIFLRSGGEDVTEIERSEGNWSISDTTVVFTPDALFGGGVISEHYRLLDESDHTDMGYLTIEFPRYIETFDDNETLDNGESAYISVESNDVYPSDSAQLNARIYDPSQDEYVDEYITDDGRWYIDVDTTICFEPDDDFEGDTSISITYKLSDEYDNEDTATLTLNYE
jgi:hypothetical protein